MATTPTKTTTPGPIATQTAAISKYTPQQVSQINSAREANVNAGRSAYSGAGATDYSTAQGQGVPGSVAETPTTPTAPVPTPQAGTQQLDPNAQAPQGMVDQASQLQGQVNTLASQKGLTLKQNTTGGYTAVPDLKAQYNQAHETLNQSGVNPVTVGQGSNAVQKALQGVSQQESPSILGPVSNEDPGLDSLWTEYDKHFSPQVQKTSLVEQYDQMSKKLGLEGVNTELINDKAIIDGTEDSIRNEILAAGGSASMGQIQTMANARNKQLIQNYNKLLDTKTALTTQLSTLMQLSVQDRQFAEAEFDRKLNFGFKMAEFKQKATDNARTSFKWMIENSAGASLIANPYETALAAKTLGTTPQLLTEMIMQKEQDRVLALEKGQLQNEVLKSNLLTDKAQRANINSQIAERNAAALGDPAVNSQTLQGMLNVYKSTGVIPAFGLSAKNPLRAQFYAALGADGGIVNDANTNKTVRAGLTTAYKTQQNLLAANQTAIGTLDQQLELVQQYSDKVDRTNSPLVNKYQLGLKTGVFGDPDAAALNNIVKTASYEFAKILSGSAASISGVSVQSAADAESMLNSAMTKGQFTKVLDLMKQESRFRLKSQADTLSQLEKDLNNVGQVSEELKQSTQPIAPKDIPVGYYQASDGLLYKK